MRDKLFRGIAILLCAVMVAIPVFNNNMLTAQAAETTSNVSVNKIFDMALSKAGVVASPTTINSVKDYLYALMLDAGDSYLQYLLDNDLENTAGNWQAYVNSDYYDANIPDWAVDLAGSYFVSTLSSDIYSVFNDAIEDSTFTDSDFLSVNGLSSCTLGASYAIKSDLVNLVKAVFENEVVNELGYFYIPTHKAEEFSPTLFTSPEDMATFRAFGNSLGENFSFVSVGANGTANVVCFKGGTYLVDAVSLGYTSENTSMIAQVSVYNTSWTRLSPRQAWHNTYDNYDAFIEGTSTSVTKFHNICVWGRAEGYFNVVTSDARNMIVFNSVDAMKLYVSNEAPYYTTRDYGTYSTTNDNSVTYTGDYMIEYGDTTTYGDITTNNDYSQDTIDNSVTYITNNYNYATPEGDEGGSGSGSGDSGIGLGDALTSLIQGVGDFFAFILSLLGELVSLVSNFLTSALEMLKGLTGLFSGFTGLLGAIFPFIPQELIDVLTTGITLIVLIGVIRSFK